MPGFNPSPAWKKMVAGAVCTGLAVPATLQAGYGMHLTFGAYLGSVLVAGLATWTLKNAISAAIAHNRNDPDTHF